jgi:succinate dehydrogenase / fumarate reductase, membrane anchor subunit
MAIKARSFKDARSQAKSNPELVWWVFMRLSGTFLVLLTFFHLFNNYIIQSELGWDYDSVVYKYSDITEKLYLLALLSLGVAHGTNGLRYVIDDTTSRSPQARFWIKLTSYTVIVAILVFGILALLIPPVPKP